MKNNYLVYLCSLFYIFFAGCEKDEEINQQNTSNLKKESLSGFVQKGPFVNGTQILMSELNSDLEQTGKVFSTQITSNKGSFQIKNIALTSSYVEFSSSGFYFDEVKGDISASQLNLFALSDITDISTVNVNLMTHLEKRRIEYLITKDQSFEEAKRSAQTEILSIFGFEKEGIQASENLDISVNKEDNAILLAISVILQGERSVGDLTELLADISADIREDGVLNNEEILNALRNSAIVLDPVDIRKNLQERYASLDLEANIPPFETYIREFLSFTASNPEGSGNTATEITSNSATLNAFVNPNSALTEIVFQYGTTEELGKETPATQNPLLADRSTPVNATVSDLSPGTTYFYRVKSSNDIGTNYSDISEFTTLGSGPVFFETTIKNIQPHEAVFTGTLSIHHLDTEVTLEYGKTEELGHNQIITLEPGSGDDPKPFEFHLAELEPATQYFAKLKATNELGEVTSNLISFTTTGAAPKIFHFSLEDVEPDMINISGKVLLNELSTTITVEYGTSPEFENSIVPTQETVIENMEVDIFGSLTDLKPDTEYYIRLKAENELGVSFSEEELIVKTETAQISFTHLSYTAGLDYLFFDYDTNGSTDEGILSHGVVLSQSANPTIENGSLTAGTGPKPFYANVYDFDWATTYYVRAYATNKFGTYYSEEIMITTASIPVAYTNPNFNWTGTRIIGGGKVDFVGVNTSAGLCWSESPNPTIHDNFINADLYSDGDFSAEITGLEYGKTYYVRAFASNEVGTSYGEEMKITTSRNPMVGDPYEGGIVVYVYKPLEPGYVDGEVHGLIAANEDQEASQWGCYSSDVTGLSDFLNTGQQNTKAIVNYHDNLQDYYSDPMQCHFNNDGSVAAKICDDLVLNGFDDWYLPSRMELQYLEENKHFLGIQSGMYWSSSVGQNSVNTGYNQYSELIPKTSKLKVRAFRSF